MPKHPIKIVVRLLALSAELRAYACAFAAQAPCWQPQATSRGLGEDMGAPRTRSDTFAWMPAGGILTAARAATGM